MSEKSEMGSSTEWILNLLEATLYQHFFGFEHLERGKPYGNMENKITHFHFFFLRKRCTKVLRKEEVLSIQKISISNSI